MTGSFQNEIPAARINLKLDVGKGDAKRKVELPLKMLVLGDFTLRPQSQRIADREKISVDRNNFEQVMANSGLKLSFMVENRLSGQGEIHLELDISGMDSFKPETIARKVPSLGRLLAARNLLKDLKSNLLDNREFRKRLEEIIRNPQTARSLHAELVRMVPELQDKS